MTVLERFIDDEMRRQDACAYRSADGLVRASIDHAGVLTIESPGIKDADVARFSAWLAALCREESPGLAPQ